MDANSNLVKKSTWLITAKTNLHVGDESSTGYGLIDKSVQRDALTELPCINSSSLKGALNEYCSYSSLSADQVHAIFGSDKKEKKRDSQKGKTLFFDANILFLPVQDDISLYKLAYCGEVLNRFIENSILFGSMIDEKTILSKVKETTNKELVRIEAVKEFKELCGDDELPIIARNVLENGESKNLWYEQVIPMETIFYTFLQSPDSNLENILDKNIIQIGANATIGYGYCKFTKI
jgi:CRISPR-associated protein Cmr4